MKTQVAHRVKLLTTGPEIVSLNPYVHYCFIGNHCAEAKRQSWVNGKGK